MADEVDGVADVEDGLGGEQLVAVQLDPVLGRRVFRMPAVTPTHMGRTHYHVGHHHTNGKAPRHCHTMRTVPTRTRTTPQSIGRAAYARRRAVKTAENGVLRD